MCTAWITRTARVVSLAGVIIVFIPGVAARGEETTPAAKGQDRPRGSAESIYTHTWIPGPEASTPLTLWVSSSDVLILNGHSMDPHTELVLTDPEGRVRDAGSLGDDYRGRADENGKTFEYRIDAPAPGSWSVEVRTRTGGLTMLNGFEIGGPSVHGLDLAPNLDAGASQTFRVSIADDEMPVLGATVVAEIVHSDRTSRRIVLTDDGLAPDETAGDGEYTATLSDLSKTGEYLVEVTARGRLGDGGEIHRLLRGSFRVAGQPDGRIRAENISIAPARDDTLVVSFRIENVGAAPADSLQVYCSESHTGHTIFIGTLGRLGPGQETRLDTRWRPLDIATRIEIRANVLAFGDGPDRDYGNDYASRAFVRMPDGTWRDER